MSLEPEFQLPNYNNCLVNLSNSILKEFGVTPLAPTLELAENELLQDARVSTLLVKTGLCKSQSDARKQIEQNAVSVNEVKISDQTAVVSVQDFSENGLLLKKGKKSFYRIVLI